MPMNPARTSTVIVCLIAVASLVAGCGGDGKKGDGYSTPAKSKPKADVPAMPVGDGTDPGIVTAGGGTDNSKNAHRATANLTIVLVNEPHDSLPPSTVQVKCPDTTGDREAACNLLTDHPEVLEPPSGDTMCTEQYGGPETATVTGTFNGKPVKLKFKRTDGCEISRFTAAHKLWDDPAPA
ncbi:MAG: hypothetical protein H7123_09020 [Thermoleophilia bacterium]|nr:hypothetical protein [Thermoleophilia bacterium]